MADSDIPHPDHSCLDWVMALAKTTRESLIVKNACARPTNAQLTGK